MASKKLMDRGDTTNTAHKNISVDKVEIHVTQAQSNNDEVDLVIADNICQQEEVVMQMQRNESKHAGPGNQADIKHSKTRKLKRVCCKGVCCFGKQISEDDDIVNTSELQVSKLTEGFQPFGASIKTWPRENDRCGHFFTYVKTRTGIAKALRISKHDELLLVNGIAVTRKDHSSVLTMFRDMHPDSEKSIILVICRKKPNTPDKIIKITFSLISTDDKVICEKVTRFNAISQDSPVVAVDLSYNHDDVTGIIECGDSLYACNDNGQLTTRELNNPDGSFNFIRSVFVATIVDESSMKFEELHGVPIQTTVCVFRTKNTDQFITVIDDQTGPKISLVHGQLKTGIQNLTKADRHFFYIHSYGNTMYLESTSFAKHFLYYDNREFSLKHCKDFDEIQSTHRNRTDFQFRIQDDQGHA